MRSVIAVGAGVLLILTAGGAQAQQPAMAQAASTTAATDVGEVVAEVRRLIAAHYVLPELRPAIDRKLAESLGSGRYDVTEPSVLAERITGDLAAAANNDGHLGLSHDPERAALVGERQNDEVRGGPQWERREQLRNHGIITMRMIPGNIRYVVYDNFSWTGAKSAEALDVAMRFLAEGDAAIIDISLNRGGSPLADQYIISHFMEPGRPLVEFHMAGREEPERLSSLATLPNPRMVGKPLYVIVGENTASAAEAFAGNIAGLGLGELVGRKTAGASFRNELFGLPGGYVLSVSVGRPVLAGTGDDWEGEGVTPTIPATREQAAEVAQYHALRRLQQTAPEAERENLQLMADVLGARLYPATPALPLAAYTGTYGERTISIVNGALRYERTGGLTSTLLPVEPNVFLLESAPATRVAFTVSGDRVAAFDLVQSDGSRRSVARTDP